MATHQLGRGTVNTPLVLLKEERTIFGRLAVAEDRSLGDVIRRLAVEGLRIHHPTEADTLIEARQHHREEQIHLDL